MIEYLIWLIPITALICGILDCFFGYFGPSDGAIDAYYRLKETDPKAAHEFLNRLMAGD